jgi:hypothetical protein
MVQLPLVGLGFLIIEASRSYSDTPQLVGLLWTSVQPDTEISNTTLHAQQTDRHSFSQLDSNPQSQQASGRSPTSRTAR